MSLCIKAAPLWAESTNRFSDYIGPSTAVDAPIPGFVGEIGNGLSDSNNYVNLTFAGWADTVTSYKPAPGVANDWTNTAYALGPVTGDNFDIVSLGDLTNSADGILPGSITLHLAVPVTDAPGADFAIFENGYLSGDAFFAELGYVEVSSDGTNFTRFASVSLNTNSIGPYDGMDVRNVYNLCGKHANAYGDSWGTPFDLSELASSSNALAGTLCLTNINYIRIVDITGDGYFRDSLGNPIYDPWLTYGSGGVDLEAVGVIHSPGYARIKLTATGPGKISPYGVPDVALLQGESITFDFEAKAGHHLLDVVLNGVSLGATNAVTIANIQSNQTVEVIFGNYLTISSPYGTGLPPCGRFGDYGEMSASMVGAVTNGQYQYACIGWLGSGCVPTNGSGCSATFSLTNDSSITWLWTTNYLFSSATISEGRVSPAARWCAPGEHIRLTATPDPYFHFSGWSGDTEGDTNSATMTLTMNTPKQVTAAFSTTETTNGVPVAWLEAYGLTNQAPAAAAMADPDGDGMPSWQEFYAGTDPADPDSVFAIIRFGSDSNGSYIIWTGGTNGSQRPFTVMGTDRPAGQWHLLNAEIERSASGTNIWHSSDITNKFYRINVNTD
jgi:hypothetical protein